MVEAAEPVSGQTAKVGSGSVSTALTRKQTLVSGGGAPQASDLRLLEDGGEFSEALVSDAILIEAASEGQSRELRERRFNGR